MKKRHKYSLGAFAAGLATVVSIYAGANAMGFKLDRPAWYSEALALADAIDKLGKDIDSRELRRLRAEADDIEVDMQLDEKAGRPFDPVKALRLRQKRRQIDELEKAK